MWISRLSKQDKPSATWVSIIQSNPLRALREQKWRKKKIPLSFLEMDHPSLLPLDIRAPGSQTFRLRLNYATSIPGSLSFRKHMMRLLGLHNCINPISLSFHPWFRLSGECWLIKISGRLSSPALLFKVVLAIQVLCWIEVVIKAILVLLLDSYAIVHH